jgi:asparagine synthase (glutamine-hydrolysing)
MCGINGIYGLEGIADPKAVVSEMNRCLAHRGPDAEGVFQKGNVAVGHRRLSIINTLEDGNQPFHSGDGQLSIVFNGELYNYIEIKAQLKDDYAFKTKTDTEVILAAYQKWGKNCLSKFNGMFAFALYDHQKEELVLVRDRLGIKPLYLAQIGDQLIFSSEIRALLASGLVPRKLNQDALVDYLRYQTVQGPFTLVEGVQLMPAGTMVTLSDNEMKTEVYWDLAANSSGKAQGQNTKEIQSEIREKLARSVELRMRADVPFGAFLSGGIDSSAIVGLMAEVSDNPVSTFSVTFDESEFSEARYAEIVAKKFNTKHHDIKLDVNDFRNMIPDALSAMDHPSGDGPNTYVVSKVTKASGITMALSGLGGDELFGGYAIFKQAATLLDYKWAGSFPKFMRKAGGNLLQTLKPSVATEKMTGILSEDYLDLEHAYPWSRLVLSDNWVSDITGRKVLPPNSVKEHLLKALEFGKAGFNLPYLSKVSLAEMDTYMQHVLLRDSDQMSMAHALEVRVPFLDHELVEYVIGIPDPIKHPHTPKKLLVDALGDLLPSEIVHRPKMGFTLPWAIWMKEHLRSFCEEKLTNLGQREVFNNDAIQRLWSHFLNGTKHISYSRIWHLVVLENWMEEHGIQ